MVNKNFQNIKVKHNKKCGEKQLVLECNIDTQNQGGVEKLLALSTAIKSVNCEKDESLKLSGRIAVKMCYINEQKKLSSLDYNCDFLDSINIEEDGEIYCTANIIDTQYSVNSNEVRVQTVLNIDCFATSMKEVEALVDTDVIPLKRDKALTSLRCYVKDNLIASDTIEGKEISEALMCNSDALVSSVRCENNKVSIDGKCYVNLTYESEGEPITKNLTIPFNKSIECKGIDENCFANCDAIIEDSKIYIDDSQEDNSITVELNIQANIFVYSNESYTLITDVFCPTSELSIKKDTIEYVTLGSIGELEEKITGSIMIDEEKKYIRRILSSCVLRNTIANSTALNKSVLLEGVLLVSVIYENEDGEIENVTLEMPYSFENRDERANELDYVTAKSCVIDLFARVRRDSEIEINASINIGYSIYYNEICEIITEVEEGESKTSDLKGISTYLVSEGETLWGVAKVLGVTIETIIEQNPYIERELKGGERIVVYREIKSNS